MILDRPAGANQGRDVLVAGAGIGGLAAALCLARQGARVTVLERAPVLRDVGAGIQVSPNGYRVLRALGLDGAIDAAGQRSEAVVLRSGSSGRLVARLRLPGATRAHWRLLHRADLLDLLAEACRASGANVRLGAEIAQVAVTGHRPVVELTGGERLSADLLVGADGIRSVVRGALGEAAPARFTGQAAWRAIVRPLEQPEAVSTVHLFAGRHVVTYPLRGGTLLNVIAVAERAEWAAEGWDVACDPDLLRAAYPGAHPALRRLLEEVTRTHLWGLFRHPVATRWGASGIALVGDAAHPTLPFLAQGANLALEDAWALAAETDAPVSLDRALRNYQSRRRERAARAIEAAAATAHAYHLAGARRRMAHAALRLGSTFAPRLLTRRTAWLHDHDETRGETLPAAPDPLASLHVPSGVDLDP